MSSRSEILSRLAGHGGEEILYVPDLTLWYSWHKERNSLPDQWRDCSLPEICRSMGVPVWQTLQPWRLETPGIEIETTEEDGNRAILTKTSAGTLTTRRKLGADGSWWYIEYPVKTEDDLPAALEIVKSWTYVLDANELEDSIAAVGEDGVAAVEIPRRPYSDMMHELLGWSEGFMLLAYGPAAIPEILSVLEAKLQDLVQQVAELPGEVVYSPDNLDGQFISPPAFEEHFAGSYRQTAEALHANGKRLLVHIGGPAARLIAPLRQAGVDGVEGIAGPPQGDASLSQAREAAGPDLTLWGGISQDFLSSTHEMAKLEEAVARAADEAKEDGRMILGIADRVPVEADLERVTAVSEMVGG